MSLRIFIGFSLQIFNARRIEPNDAQSHQNDARKCQLMPIYEYECELDGIFEWEFPMGDALSVMPCRVCGGNTTRKFSPTLSIFKGRGWGGSK